MTVKKQVRQSNEVSAFMCVRQWVLNVIVLVSVLFLANQAEAGQVGTTTGSFEVTAGGQAAYTMGIEVPPGIMGVVPQVAITYSSDGGNGLLGLGGSLSGLSSITRCGKTFAQDGVSRAVQLNSTDFFCLNGQRLILMSGTYGANGSTYQTEIESFQRVTAKGSVGTGPAYFEVLTKGGSTLVFGKSLTDTNHPERNIDSITGGVASWGISYLEDEHGNRVIYEYKDESRTTGDVIATQIVPKRITYGHNERAGVTGNLAIEFEYEIRPDTLTGYVRGKKFISDLRLSNIKTKVDADMVKDYRITYDQSSIGRQSRMTQLTECSGQGNCLLPITFTWQDYSHDWTQGISLPTAALTSEGKLRGAAADVNNDGHTDWITAVKDSNGDDSLQTYLNHNGTWRASSSFVPPAPIFDYQRHEDGISISELVDLNSDGKVDWVLAYTDANGTINSVFMNNGTGWVYDSNRALPTVLADLTNSSNPEQRAEFIDLNGDARPDLVSSYRNSAGTPVKQTWINTGTGWQSSPSFAAPDVLIDYQLHSEGAATGFLIDINNDGLSDFVKAHKNATGSSVLSTWLNTGSGWQSNTALRLPSVLADYSGSNPQGIASPVDINGDGLLDIVQAHQYADGSTSKNVWLNTGNGWTLNNNLAPPAIVWQQTGSSSQAKGSFIDVSNDGLADLVLSYTGSSGSSNTVWRNTGGGWVQDNSLALPSYLTQIISGSDSRAKGLMIDANSDGRGDFLSSAGGSSSTIHLHGTDGNSFAHPELITVFRDGLGNAHAAEFAPSTFQDVYTPYTDATYPDLDIVGPMLLVSAVESSVGVAMHSRAEHQYFGKKVNLLGRGDLGFAKKIATDTRTNVRIETEFSQTYPFIGSPVSMQKFTGGGTKLMESTNSYAIKELFGGKTQIIYQSVKSNTNYELNGQEIDTTTNETLNLDDYGNVLTTRTTRVYQGGSSAETYISTQSNNYANSEVNWQIGRMIDTTETVSAPNTPVITSKTAFTYYANGSLNTKVIEPDSSQAVTETYTYDDFGHISSTTISAPGVASRTTTATYTANGRFAASATNPLGHTTSSEYHPFFGHVTRTEGPNGSVNTKLYDDHGRMIKTSKIRTDADEAAGQDHANNVVVFHPCSDANLCPDNAAYFLGVIDNEGEAPETVYYDNRNREVRKQTQGFDGTSVYVDTQYDSFGRKYKVSKPYYKDATEVYWTTYHYDLLGRVKKVITPANKEIRTDYYVGRTVVTNPLGQTKTTYVNGQGKPVKIVDHQGNDINYTYDASGRLLTTIAGSDLSTKITLEYDWFGRKIKQNDPDLGEWEYQYDALGQLVLQQDAKDQVVTMEYDQLGRIIKRTEPEGITQWEYDTGSFAIGKLVRVWNDRGYERTHIYDEYGRPTDVTTTIDGDATTIKTDYHLTTDRVQYVEYPSGLRIRKEFNDYGFPISIRSSSQNYLDRYEAAEAQAATLADDANVYKNSTAATRQSYLDTYNAEKDAAENEELEISADERRYHRALPGYNGHVNRQKEAIEQAKHFERWGNSFRLAAFSEQRKAVINLWAADMLVNMAQQNYRPVSSFDFSDTNLWPNGGGAEELTNFVSYILNISPAQFSSAWDYVAPADLAHTAGWMAQHGENHAANAKRLMGDASARYEQVQINVAAAEAHANHANTYYQTHLKVITDRIEWRVGIANAHYAAANDAANEIETIDTNLKAKVDSAVNAQRQAQALLNYYENEGSELHWLAEQADAEGKITKFSQGKHVTTHVEYQASTGRLAGVFSESNPEPIELEAGQSIPNTTTRLHEFIADVQSTQTEAAGFAATSLDQLIQTQTLISSLDPNDPQLSQAMQLATQAQIDALLVNESILNVDYQLNTDVTTLTGNTLSNAQNLQSEFDGINNDSSLNANQATNNVLVYNARVHALIASYHSQLKVLYEYASHQQSQKATDITNIGAVDADFLQEYADLGLYHSSMADIHQTRADNIQPSSGEEADFSPEVYGLAKASFRQKKLIDRHADISNKRRRLNVALFAPLQHLNEASREKYAAMNSVAKADHFASNKLLGRNDRERFKKLERLYRDRLAVLEVNETEDNDIFASDTERKALYQYLADINTELGKMYTSMSEQTYWDGMFEGFAQSLNDKSAVYDQLASNHHQIAANNELLASKSSNAFDHNVLGSDDTILSDFYKWDDIGNLTERRHTVADLTETFQYDELNRLTRSAIDGSSVQLYQLAGNDVVTYEYNELGNITFKSDVGSYSYGSNAGPHAVTAISGDSALGQKNTSYAYDANGNMLSGDGRVIEYTSFNKPKHIAGDGNPSEFKYGPERQLIKQVERDGTVPKTTLYFGQYERIYDGYQITEKYHLSTHNGGVIAVIIDSENEPAPKTHYLHRDHLDSIVAITNEQGYVVERFFYDAFGKQLTAVNPDGNKLYTSFIDNHLTDRGFTGHKQIQSGLIHMGGRVYDPAIGRFLSADPHIQFAGNLQNYNRYSYVNNNPLAFNDPTGYFISKIFKAIKKLFKAVFKVIKKVIKVIKKVVKFIKENLRAIVAVVAVVVTVGAATPWVASLGTAFGTAATATTAASLTLLGSATVGAIAGGLAGLITTGSLSGALKGAVLGFVGGGIAYGISGVGNFIAGKGTLIAQGVNAGLSGGVMSRITGGSFSKGFKNALITFGAFKAIDAVTGVFTKLADFGRSLYEGRNTRTLSASIQRSDAKKPSADQKAAKADLEKLIKDGDLDTSKVFTTPDEAAKEVLKKLQPITEARGVEIGGNIIKNGDGYSYADLTVGNEGSVSLASRGVAGFHTHPDGASLFSGPGYSWGGGDGDKGVVRDTGNPLYMSYADQQTGNIHISVCNPGSRTCNYYAPPPDEYIQRGWTGDPVF